MSESRHAICDFVREDEAALGSIFGHIGTQVQRYHFRFVHQDFGQVLRIKHELDDQQARQAHKKVSGEKADGSAGDYFF